MRLLLEMRRYWVYLLASRSRVLYVGVTADLRRRVAQHRAGEGSAFTRRYRVHRLVYAECCGKVVDAIAWEKRIKSWRRSRKLELIERANPEWRDLAEDPDPLW